MAAYSVRQNIDLTNARDREPIADSGQPIEAVAVLDLTAGAEIQIHLGRGQGIPINSPTAIQRICPRELDGVALSHAAQPGAIATIVVFFSGAEVT